MDTGYWMLDTFAWYGHLKFKEMKWFETLPLVAIVLISWHSSLRNRIYFG